MWKAHNSRIPRKAGGLAVVVALTLALGACGEDTRTLASGAEYTIEGALTEVPASVQGDRTVIVTADLASAKGVKGLVNDPSFEESLGSANPNIGAFIEAGSPPVSVITGRFAGYAFPSTLIVMAASTDPRTGDEQRQKLVGDFPRVRFRDDMIAAASSGSLVQEWADGPVETLADDPSLAAVAASLDASDSVAAIITDGSPMPTTLGLKGTVEQVETLAEYDKILPAHPFDKVGVGWRVNNAGQTEISVTYHFGNAEIAAANADVLAMLYTEGSSLRTGEPLADLVTFEGARVDGTVARVTLTLRDDVSPDVVSRMLVLGDTPFLYRSRAWAAR